MQRLNIEEATSLARRIANEEPAHRPRAWTSGAMRADAFSGAKINR